MRVLLFGATGMVGQGVLRECLLAPDVEAVQTIGRSRGPVAHPKLREIVRANLMHFSDFEAELSGFLACFYCLGVSSAGMAEAEYTRLTYDLTLAAAETLARLNPMMTFVYVSGAGTDSTERGRIMWARVKGRTENAILRLPFKAAYMFRPGLIQPLHGERSKATATRVAYAVGKPILPLLRQFFPRHVLTTEQIAQAMLQAVRSGAEKKVLESWDIRELARSAA